MCHIFKHVLKLLMYHASHVLWLQIRQHIKKYYWFQNLTTAHNKVFDDYNDRAVEIITLFSPDNGLGLYTNSTTLAEIQKQGKQDLDEEHHFFFSVGVRVLDIFKF